MVFTGNTIELIAFIFPSRSTQAGSIKGRLCAKAFGHRASFNRGF